MADLVDDRPAHQLHKLLLVARGALQGLLEEGYPVRGNESICMPPSCEGHPFVQTKQHSTLRPGFVYLLGAWPGANDDGHVLHSVTYPLWYIIQGLGDDLFKAFLAQFHHLSL